MYGTSDSLDSIRQNTNDSTIKEVIDTWYSNNLSSYTKYISTTAVYCNDRTEYTAGTYTIENTEFLFTAFGRLCTNKTPTYDCTNSKDAFSVSNSEAKLNYPIGLMTADEVAYAGGVYNTKNLSAWYYLNNGGSSITGSYDWFLLSPAGWNGRFAVVFLVSGSSDISPGVLFVSITNDYDVVRPVISIKSDVLWSSGNGSPESPYEIIYN